VADLAAGLEVDELCWILRCALACQGAPKKAADVGSYSAKRLGLTGLPRVFRTADFVSIYAASCEFMYAVRTSCGVR